MDISFNITAPEKRKLLTGNEHITFYGMPINALFGDFMSWYSSSIMDSGIRGALMEFVVGKALDIDFDEARSDNQSYDLKYGDCLVEVKASAYLQEWVQTRPSNISFSIRPTHDIDTWVPARENYDTERLRVSDVYVFCLYKYRDKPTANPLILEHWEFYVLPATVLNEKCGSQKSILLHKLLELNPTICEYDGIKSAVDAAFAASKKAEGQM